MDPLEAYREGLALARRAGMSWSQREPAAYEAALAVAPTKTERSDWACALYDARARLDARLRATADRLVVVANMLPRTRSLACRDADPLVFREQGGGIRVPKIVGEKFRKAHASPSLSARSSCS